MKLERADVLQAAPYERTDERRGYANGFKPKAVKSRLGRLELKVPQVRGVEFYPSTLERGERSARSLKLALAEMYVQGVSTRKVQKITQELCGLDVSSADVSRATALLDEELEAWRNRPLGRVSYLILDARCEKVRHGGSARDCAVLIAIGVLPKGKRSILVAGGFTTTFAVMLSLCGIMGICVYATGSHPTDSPRAAIADIMLTIALIYLPMFWAGTRTINRSVRGLWVGLVYCIAGLSLTTLGLFGILFDPGTFGSIKVRLPLFSLLGIVSMTGVLLHIVAVATRHAVRGSDK